jgi:hypothetical protein
MMARPRPFHLQRRRDLETFVPGAPGILQPGGAYPGKVDKQITQYCQVKGVPVPDYLQYRAHADTVNRLAHVKLVEEIQIIGCMLFLS